MPQEKGNNFHPNIGIAQPLSTFDERTKKKTYSKDYTNYLFAHFL